MKQYGLIGYPLGHSFSAAFFKEKFECEHTQACYTNFPMENVEGLREMIATHPEICGLNVTIPHKQHVIPLLDEISDEAKAIGAVNVIAVRREPTAEGATFTLKGYNSDVIGFRDSLCPLLQSHHRRALVLGTGGASRAVIAALKNMGLEVCCVSRRKQPQHCGAPVITYAEITPETMANHLVVVNCTPLGMSPHTDAAPDIPYEALTDRHIAYDLIYNPSETLFLKQAAAQGCVTKNGLEMLHLQAEASWKFWTEP